MLAVAALAPSGAVASAPGDPVVAQRLAGRVVLDGRLEEPDWDLAPVHDGFVQQFPEEGAAPSERTEVRVLYDDRALYVGVVARDVADRVMFVDQGEIIEEGDPEQIFFHSRDARTRQFLDPIRKAREV